MVRAALNLCESVGRSEGLQERLLNEWIEAVVVVVRRAVVEGDIDERGNPQDVGRLIVSLHMGLRQTSVLDNPQRFLLDLEKSLGLVLNGVLQPDRLDYFKQFIRRRAALAIDATSAPVRSD
jgi:hypothetical protein